MQQELMLTKRTQKDDVLDFLSGGFARSTGFFCDRHILRVGSIVHRLRRAGYDIDNVETDKMKQAQYVWSLGCGKRGV